VIKKWNSGASEVTSEIAWDWKGGKSRGTWAGM
jgi:hypothetical protein